MAFEANIALLEALDAKGNIYASKTELLEWVNGLLQLNLTRLEQFASGAVFCQILDAYFKDKIAIHKVNFYATTEYDAIANYKILQTGFTALRLTRDINVAKLSRGSKVDTLELLQYLYKYLLKMKTLEDYDGQARRELTVPRAPDGVEVPEWMTPPDTPGTTADEAAAADPAVDGTTAADASAGTIAEAAAAAAIAALSGGAAAKGDSSAGDTPAAGGAGDDAALQQTIASFPLSGFSSLSSTYTFSPTSTLHQTGATLPRSSDAGTAAAAPSRLSNATDSSGPGSAEAADAAQPNGAVEMNSTSSKMSSALAACPTSKIPTVGTAAAKGAANSSSEAASSRGRSATRSASSNGSGAAGTPPRAAVSRSNSASGSGGQISRSNSAAGRGQISRSNSANGRGQVAGSDSRGQISRSNSRGQISRSNSVNSRNGALSRSNSANGRGPSPAAGSAAAPRRISSSSSSTSASEAGARGAAAGASTPGRPPSAPARNRILSAAGSSASRPGTAGAGAGASRGSAGGGVSAGGAAAGGVQRPPSAPLRPGAAAAGKVKQNKPEKALAAREEDEKDVEVYNVMSQPEEVAASAARRGDAESNTRLVVSEQALTARPQRPMSPSGRDLLCNALDVVQEAIENLTKVLGNLKELPGTLGCSTDSYGYRGKICSLQDVCGILPTHTGQLLQDVLRAMDARATNAEAQEIRARHKQLSLDLSKLQTQLSAAGQQLTKACAKRQVKGVLLLPLTHNQKQLTCTSALDGSLKAVGTVQASLMLRLQTESAAAAKSFLESVPIGGAGQAAGSISKVLKLGNDCLKRLRNGDIYRGQYQGTRKSGEGVYSFTNLDAYEGEFKDDRMAGTGVYTFYPEGRYEGEWQAALYQGAGCETFAKGSTYHGQYAAGARHGWGICRFPNGDYYEGQWAKGVREGVGMQQCMDDSNYTGEYQKGKRHGYGVYSFPNGDQYLGEYEDDVPTGYGVYMFSSGQKYEGRWEKGKKHGWSIYTVETGQRWAGSWVEGKPQWVQPLAEGAEAAGLKQEEAANMNTAAAAAQMAQEAMKVAAARATEHWLPHGEVQLGLQNARMFATNAAAAGQVARAKAQAVAARLDAAALLVEQGSRAASGMSLVA